MSKSKKYDCRLIEEKKSWTAEITRRVSTKKTVVSKSQDGFSSESEAQAWCENKLESFIKSQDERNKRHSEKRKQDEKNNDE